ncbi:hypothetical protein Pcinc_017714 [Petrolisthes cinctipes]|uniref:Uncharacterized protein n=1 Tax=Petrolisthes cinctipes TaxID=88211 RepID=A0AAE1KNG3_PETCI|nr:hypothetical protein Pcinc_017714 [Petrolisthes cinctipes]
MLLEYKEQMRKEGEGGDEGAVRQVYEHKKSRIDGCSLTPACFQCLPLTASSIHPPTPQQYTSRLYIGIRDTWIVRVSLASNTYSQQFPQYLAGYHSRGLTVLSSEFTLTNPSLLIGGQTYSKLGSGDFHA